MLDDASLHSPAASRPRHALVPDAPEPLPTSVDAMNRVSGTWCSSRFAFATSAT